MTESEVESAPEQVLGQEDENPAEPTDELGATAAETPKRSRLPEIPIAQVMTITCEDDLKRALVSHRAWMAAVLDPKIEVAAGRANLSGQDLRGYDLRDVNLSAANLSGANLQGVDLQAANLTAANLTNAMLACANLSGAKLRGARIDGADLRGADLTGAILTGLDLTRAVLKSPESPAEAVVPVCDTAANSVEGKAPHVDV